MANTALQSTGGRASSRGASHDRPTDNYTRGTRLITAASAGLVLTNLALIGAIVQDHFGDEGAVYFAFLAEPPMLVFLLVVLASLLSTALRRRPVPDPVRRKRLIASIAGCSSFLATIATAWLLH